MVKLILLRVDPAALFLMIEGSTHTVMSLCGVVEKLLHDDASVSHNTFHLQLNADYYYYYFKTFG